jgi:hypothetical protein
VRLVLLTVPGIDQNVVNVRRTEMVQIPSQSVVDVPLEGRRTVRQPER